MSAKRSDLIIKLINFSDSYTQAGLRDRNNLELVRRIRLLHLVSLTAIIVLLIMSVIRFIEGHSVLAAINIAAAILFIVIRIYLEKTGNYARASIVELLLCFAFLLFFFVTGGNNNAGHVWSFLFPVLASFLLGSKSGFIITFIYILIVVFSGIFHFQFQAVYPMEFRICFSMSLFTLSIFSFYGSFLIESNARKHANTNNHLHKVVKGLKQTELQLIEAKEIAEKSNRSKSKFLRNMSHELRTPLNHIIGFSQLLMDGIPGSLNDTQQEYLNDVLTSSTHLLALINDLLDLSSIESGKLKVNPEQMDLTEILTQTVDIFKAKGDKKYPEFILVFGTLPDTIIADKRLFIQIIYNLLSNAVKFTADNGTVTISAETSQDKNDIIIRIKDTGIGIATNSMDLIFESFGQVEADVIRKYEGTGLGLALTKNLVELHGGNIWVESDGLGLGSTFNFTHPIIEARKGSKS